MKAVLWLVQTPQAHAAPALQYPISNMFKCYLHVKRLPLFPLHFDPAETIGPLLHTAISQGSDSVISSLDFAHLNTPIKLVSPQPLSNVKANFSIKLFYPWNRHIVNCQGPQQTGQQTKLQIPQYEFA